MPAPKLDFHKLISQVPEHVGDMPPESARPIEHFQLDAGGYWNLLRYFDRKTADGYPAPRERHVLRLRSMVVLGIVETLERLLKETAAVCVDQLAGRVLDDRFAALSVNARSIAAHFEERPLERRCVKQAPGSTLGTSTHGSTGCWPIHSSLPHSSSYLTRNKGRTRTTGGGVPSTSCGSCGTPLRTIPA